MADNFYSFAFWQDGEYIGRVLAYNEPSAIFQQFGRNISLAELKQEQITFTIELPEEQPEQA